MNSETGFPDIFGLKYKFSDKSKGYLNGMVFDEGNNVMDKEGVEHLPSKFIQQ